MTKRGTIDPEKEARVTMIYHSQGMVPYRPENSFRITMGDEPAPEPEAPFDPLAFWLHPDWTQSSRDNPRDPNFEPFWMRDPVRKAKSDGLDTPRPVVYGRTGVRQYQAEIENTDRVLNCPSCGALGVKISDSPNMRCRTGHVWLETTGALYTLVSSCISRPQWKRMLDEQYGETDPPHDGIKPPGDKNGKR